MILYPNAKINLGLNIVGKRTDGYHDLETVFVPVRALHDRLELSISEESVPYCFEQEGIAVDCANEDNLVVRAYLRMCELFPQVKNVHIRFCKQIPFGAGLGGGSSDAAHVVKGVNALFGLGLTASEMEQIVSPLGADCAFFVQNKPLFAEGIGDIFSAVPDTLVEQLEGKWLLLVKPECAVSTRAAYKGVVVRHPDVPLRKALQLPIEQWQTYVINDFEQSVFPQFPAIASAKEQLLAAGAVYAAMSGSGATVFGIFRERPEWKPEETFYHLEQMKF